MKEWRCKDCGAIFTSSQSDYDCPVCHGSNTIPADYKPTVAMAETTKVQERPERHCPECVRPCVAVT